MTLSDNTSIFKFFGLAGSLVIIAGSILPALVYCGRQGERFSVFNHYISELGERGVSRWAQVFNVALTLGGLLLIPWWVGLGLLLPGWWSKLGMVAGSVTSIGVTFIGLYPMNDLKHHNMAALVFFRGGLVTVLLFNLAFWLQPLANTVIPRATVLAGIIAAACYAAFILLTARYSDPGEIDEDPPVVPPRPAFWLIPTVEWAVYASTVLWFFWTALAMKIPG